MNQSNQSLNNWFLILAVLALGVAPLIFVPHGKFGGSDDKAKAAITEIQPEYKPWFQSPFTPASGEIASLLFASQAALGAGVVGYAIGVYKGRSKRERS
ncbi:energy-coupling factor ABC transporter substrate-binding protein [Dolichospermum circinale CS-1225]|jgi:cobalt/nickel transport protein|uniref:Cobalt transport protein CbiN n=1 Tax=Dolichospermum circinale CS-537/01 TaxID=3021739 RepID=A0ABT5A566_9CYAN|nr:MULTISPECIES: energy-coupling factor ABC transporter substrate-binding protein [Dolichospermum]MBD1213014.1 energy-coupling factor ABC transporter substrate-binding protein [Dolichospermum circinale Clear-D4]MCE2720266.1 energy-coupling factor ABC transporter substrate-binding protein [Anabaena sp. 49628_E55]MDB9460835.1 energy-coupling factor ABC transporter substrate-binding protein [Dolichospermum circinale CS-545/17]MDB9482407.1 energy-coupling factor ABC transporter substrate-binding pr